MFIHVNTVSLFKCSEYLLTRVPLNKTIHYQICPAVISTVAELFINEHCMCVCFLLTNINYCFNTELRLYVL